MFFKLPGSGEGLTLETSSLGPLLYVYLLFIATKHKWEFTMEELQKNYDTTFIYELSITIKDKYLYNYNIINAVAK